MQPFSTKTLLSMLAGSFHLACKVTLTSWREAILPSPLYILPNTTQRYYFVISLKFPSQRGAFCLVWRYAVSCFVPERHTKRRLRPYGTATHCTNTAARKRQASPCFLRQKNPSFAKKRRKILFTTLRKYAILPLRHNHIMFIFILYKSLHFTIGKNAFSFPALIFANFVK